MWSEVVCGVRQVWSEAASFTYPVVCQLLVEALVEVELMAVVPGHLVGVGQDRVGHPRLHSLLPYVSCLRVLPWVCKGNCVRRGENRCQWRTFHY